MAVIMKADTIARRNFFEGAGALRLLHPDAPGPAHRAFPGVRAPAFTGSMRSSHTAAVELNAALNRLPITRVPAPPPLDAPPLPAGYNLRRDYQSDRVHSAVPGIRHGVAGALISRAFAQLHRHGQRSD